MTLLVVVLASSTLLLLAVVMSLVLGWANQAFHVEIDPRVEEIERVLPGANCAGCGYVGCGDYAEAVALDGASAALCAPGGESCAQAVAEIMGVELQETWPYRAVVHCSATLAQRLGVHDYRGERSCAAANLVADFQGCVYGCLGLGDCAAACTFDAMQMTWGLVRIDYDSCTGCGACVEVCPRGIISRIPFKAERVLVVACSNRDFGNDVRKVCTVGCIGCGACARLSDLFTMEANLPTLDYEGQTVEDGAFEASLEKCPMESLLYVGKPTPEDVAATLDEELPSRVEATFETSVDRAEWWG
jgi:electron transport complex protein RnfB